MKVMFVGAGPGDPDLLTVKGRRLLKECRICIYAGSLVSDQVLKLIPEDAEKHDSAGMDLEQMVSVYEDASRRGIDVVRLHSGDPAIYGAIREQMNELDRMGIDYEVVPGISAFQAAAAELKTELTAPEVSQAIILTRTSGRTPMPEDQELDELARAHATLCIYLSAHKVGELAELLSHHYGQECPAAVVYRSSRPDRKIVRGTLADIGEKAAAAGITKTAVIVVGEALSKEIPASKLYDSGFSHGFRDGKQE